MGLLFHQLRPATLTELIALAQEDPSDDTAPTNEIIKRFEPLTNRLARGLTASRPDLYDDVANACRSGLVRAVRRHDTHRAGFPSYAERFMRGAGLHELKFWQRNEAEWTLRDDDGEEAAPDLIEALNHRLAPWGDGPLAEAVQELSPSQQQLAELRYVHDAPLEMIASEAGTSISAASQRLATIHRRIELALAA